MKQSAISDSSGTSRFLCRLTWLQRACRAHYHLYEAYHAHNRAHTYSQTVDEKGMCSCPLAVEPSLRGQHWPLASIPHASACSSQLSRSMGSCSECRAIHSEKHPDNMAFRHTTNYLSIFYSGTAMPLPISDYTCRKWAVIPPQLLCSYIS